MKNPVSVWHEFRTLSLLLPQGAFGVKPEWRLDKDRLGHTPKLLPELCRELVRTPARDFSVVQDKVQEIACERNAYLSTIRVRA